MKTATAVCLAGSMLLAMGSAGAQEWGLSADVDLVSAYVWRGQVANDEPVLQPSVTLESGPWSVNAWGNLDLTDAVNAQGELSELDLTLSYAGESDLLWWEIGVLSYIYPSASGDTTEVYGSLGWEGVVSPSVTLYYDVDEVGGAYLEVAVEREFSLAPETALLVGVASGWAGADSNAWYFDLEDSALADGLASLSASHEVSRGFSLSGGVAFSWIWDSSLRSAARDLYGDADFLSVMVGFSFLIAPR